MGTKDVKNKTVDTWTMGPEEIFTKIGLPIKWGNKTGACIMPAPKHLQPVKQQKKYPVDILIEKLDKISGKPGVKGNKTGSFIHISPKQKDKK